LRPGFHAQRRNAQLVDETEIRRLFIEARIEERFAAGDLTSEIDSHPIDHAFLDPGSHTVTEQFFDRNRQKVAEVHYYRQPDGSIGASKLKDPKEVLHNGIRYFLDRP
jgi:hypothetical protein